MDHDNLDKKFRTLLQNDDSALDEQEQTSKEAIWKRITAPQQKRSSFPFWQVAAAVLFFLLGGTSWFFTNKLSRQKLHLAKLEAELFENQNTLQTVQQTLVQLEAKHKSDLKNNNPSKINQAKEIIEVIKKEYIENVVYVKDTVFIAPTLSPNLSTDKLEESIKLVRDTVYIEVPLKQPSRLVDLEQSEESPTKKSLQKKNKSKKIEFVFGKKPIDKPTKNNPTILINQTEIAKKNLKGNKNSVLTFSINNN